MAYVYCPKCDSRLTDASITAVERGIPLFGHGGIRCPACGTAILNAEIPTLIAAARIREMRGRSVSPSNLERTSEKQHANIADWSFRLGALSLFVPLLLSIPAIICGHTALFKYRERGSGPRRLAIVGLVLGYVWPGLYLLATLARYLRPSLGTLRFHSPYFLGLLVLVPLLWVAQTRIGHLISGSLKYSHVTSFFGGQSRPAYPLRYVLTLALFLAALSLLILGAARPQLVKYDEPVSAMGRDIVLVLDISGSMQAEDFEPNRLQAAKQVVAEFIKSRQGDGIGLVSFAGQSFTQCPLTLDYDMLISLLESVDFDMVEDGTAIGNALGTALNRLKDSKAKSKIIVLLTDGENNRGEIDPLTAAEMAKTMAVKIYCVGVGKIGGAQIPIYDKVWGKRYAVGRDGRPVLTKLDEKTLKGIASASGGKYSRATDAESLKRIYEQIGQAEKSELEGKRFSTFKELMPYFVLPGLFLLLASLVLFRTAACVMP